MGSGLDGPAMKWIFAALIAASLPAATVSAEPGQAPTLPFEKYTLENGLQVILHHDPKLPLVAVSVWYDVGGLHERPGRTGFAHLFEHMMFQGSLHIAEDQHFVLLQQAGATEVNGTTAFDRTNYFATVPKNELDLALWLESDRMGYLLPSITKKSLENQIDVVKNERRQSVDNAPYGLMREKMTQILFPPGHPYHGNIIGSMEDLSAATVDDVRDFWLTYYTPANATLAIAGDFDPATIKERVTHWFGSLRGRPKPLPPKVEVPKLEAEKVIRFDEPVASLSRVSIAWLAPPAFAPGSAELDLLAFVISGTKSSRLDAKVSYDDQIAQSVTAYLYPNKAGSVFEIDLVVRPDRTLEEALAAIDGVLDGLRAKPPTQAELTRALNSQETRLFFDLELLGGFGGRAERLQTYNLYLQDPGKLAWDVERYRKVSLDDLKKAIDQYLTKNRLVVLATPVKRAPEGGAK
jgi:zinc protease